MMGPKNGERMLKRWGIVVLLALAAIGFKPAEADAQCAALCTILFPGCNPVSCGGGLCFGSTGTDCITGTAAGETIWGLGGGDCICGGGGDDTIYGNSQFGPGTGGNDFINGEDGSDTIFGQAGADVIFGEAGNDTISGGDGDDQLNGDAGDDDLFGDAGSDQFFGGDGADEINAGTGNDTNINGQGGNDIINLDSGNNSNINGGDGGDTINGGTGDDSGINSGPDNDTINLTAGGNNDDINGGTGADTITGGAGNDTNISGGDGDDNISGGGGNDMISGGAGFDDISGGDGDDVLSGNNDPDVLDGGPGTDILDGGTENDTCLNGETNIDCENLTHAALASFSAFEEDGDVIVEWVTSSEAGTLGYYLFREEGDQWTQVHEGLLPSVMAAQGGTYHFRDVGAMPGATLRYRLVELDGQGSNSPGGPFEVVANASDNSLLSASQFYAREPRQTVALARARKGGDIGSPQGPGQATAVVVGVDETGLYSVTAAEIASRLGVDAADVRSRIQSGTVLITEAGEPIAWSGAADGSALQFFGVELDSLFTTERFYRLSLEAGDTMANATAAPGAVTPGLSYQDTVHVEADTVAVTVIPQDPNSDYWYGQLVSESGPMTATNTITLESVAGGGTLRVTFRGAANRLDVNSIRVRLNGQELGTTSFVGQIAHEFEVAVAEADLLDGDNTLELEPVAGSAFVDFAEVTYTREYATAGSTFAFRSGAAESLELTGFVQANPRLFKVTDARQPVELTGFVDAPSGLQFAAEANQDYFVAAAGSVRSPSSMWGDVPSDLRSGANAATYLILSPPEFLGGAAELAAHRQADDLQTMIVELQDVFDEFAFGTPDPNAIRAFLQYANEEWATPPQYVVLIGKGSWDYRDIGGLGGNFLPPIMLSTPGGIYSSDVTYADVAGDDGVPDLALGRLPVTSSEQLDDVIGQILAYEAVLDGSSQEVVFVAGQTDPQGDYGGDTRLVREELAEGWTATEVFRSEFAPDGDGLLAARAALFEALGKSPRLVSYLGHGALDRLGKIEMVDDPEMPATSLFETSDLETLSIEGSQPLFNAMTCTAARFALPGTVSLGEALLIDSEGAVAAWSASGVSIHEYARELSEAFLGALTSGEDERLGDAINRSYTAIEDFEFRREMIGIYHLLGDPALRLTKGADPGTGGSGGSAGGSGGIGGGVTGGSGGCVASAASSTGGLAFGVLALLGTAIVRRRRRRGH